MSKKKRKEEKTSFIEGLGKFIWFFIKGAYYLFIWFCFFLIFVVSIELIAGIFTGDNSESRGNIFIILFLMVFLYALSFVTRKVIVNTFEFFMFGNSFGVPSGYAMVSAFILIIINSILESLYIEINDGMIILVIAISLIVSFPIFGKFATWYKNRKDREEEKETKDNRKR